MNTLFQVNRVKAIKKEQEVWYDVVASLFDPLPPVVVGAREEEGMEQEDVSYIGVWQINWVIYQQIYQILCGFRNTCRVHSSIYC